MNVSKYTMDGMGNIEKTKKRLPLNRRSASIGQ